MQPTIFRTITVPGLGSPTPATIAGQTTTPLRVLVRNTGAVNVFLSSSGSELTTRQVGSAYQLPAGQEDVFVLAPKQALYVEAAGAGGQVSYSVSEAIPVA
jgi:hypothetical protein